MATNVSDLSAGVDERLAELKSALIALKDGKNVKGESLAKNTISTMRHHFTRDQRTLSLIKDLLSSIPGDTVKLQEASLVGFNQLVYPQEVGARVQVTEGDSILALLDKYGDVKDLKTKMEKAAEKAGLKLNYITGLIDKA
jgi:hypothetical protein